MRLHHLEVEAFGPFAELTRVDFDALSQAGVFLLSGPTGAGKTSVLDAVCFALYGDVPGDRSSAKRLRCDQAAAEVAPRVLLELSIGERRFRLERSPAWERPKRRGTGLTTQQASVTMSERRDGAWTPLSSRLDETGDLVGRLLGMTLTQFTQVAMLPQGHFQTFLRAKSDERHQLLQQLFRTGRFAEVERWLRERRLSLARLDVETHQRVAEVVSRISEAARQPLPDGWDVHDLRPVADDDLLAPWAAGLHQEAQAALTAHQVEVAATVLDEETARTSLDAARATAQRRRRYADAAREQHELELRHDDHTDRQHRLELARRAAGVVPLLRHVRAGAEAAAAARERAAASLDQLAAHLGLLLPPAPAELPELVSGATRAVALARATAPRVARRRRARGELEEVERRLREAESRLEAARRDHDALPSRVEALRADVAEARSADDQLGELAPAEQALQARLAAHDLVAALHTEIEAARVEWLAAREEALTLKEQLLVLQQARIEGMAAELAGALASGCSCPVCGSSEHPAKATSAPGAPDARAEKAARARADDASLVEHAFAAKVHELESSLAAAVARAGDATAEEVSADLAALQTRRGELASRAARLDQLVAGLDETEQALGRLGAALVALGAERAGLLAAHAALETEVAALQAEIEAVLLSGSPTARHTSLETYLAHAERTESLAQAAVEHTQHARTTDRHHQQALDALTEAARDAGFDDTDAAGDHALPQDDLDALATAVEDHRRRLATVREVLAEPEAGELACLPPPDLDALGSAHLLALRRRDEAAAALHVAATRHERLTGLVADLDQACTPWRPLRDDLELTTRLSGFVEGKSPDNRLRMRLSAYVLAYRLSQVVAAANERLARMSDQRYSLEHTGHRGAGETRGGLSLLVRDDWSGETRDPATLSGGETFVVSLALALGLSDVVTHESGGAALDTLFVDEGFGSLDADTLDDVMDTLDSLRDGGRVVGLVSHVAEMRDRIPTQLVVTKARGGSTVRHRLCGTIDA